MDEEFLGMGAGNAIEEGLSQLLVTFVTALGTHDREGAPAWAPADGVDSENYQGTPPATHFF